MTRLSFFFQRMHLVIFKATKVSGEVVMTRLVAGFANAKVLVPLNCAILRAETKDGLEKFQDGASNSF
jgi:hypothetical protein